MWSVTVVILQIGSKLLPTVTGGPIGLRVRPLAQQGLNEALGLAIRPRRIGTRAQVTQVEFGTGRAKEPRDRAIPVVAQYPTDDDATRRKPRQCAPEKGGTSRRELVGQHLDVGETAVVIDRHVDVFPPTAARATPAIPVNAMPHAVNTPQRLDVHVEQVTRIRPLVALNREWWRRGRAIETEPPEPRAHRRTRDLERLADGPRRQPVLLAQNADQRDRARRRLMRRGTWPRRGVLERRDAALAKASHPLRNRPDAHGKSFGGRCVAPPFTHDPAHEHQTGRGRTLGITMKLHPGPPLI